MKRKLNFNKDDKCIIATVPRSNIANGADKNTSKWFFEGERSLMKVWGIYSEEKFSALKGNDYVERANINQIISHI